MVYRKGVGASITATLLFGVLLLSNLALLSSAGEREKLYSISDSESYLYDSAQISSGIIAFSLLTRVQALLAHTVFACSTALPTLDSELAGVSASMDSGVIRASGMVSLGLDVKANDNMTMLRPFSGSDHGRLAVSVNIAVVSDPNDLSVRYSRSESHILSLPVDFRGIISLCLSSTKAFEETLSNSTVSSCTPREIVAALGAAKTVFDDQVKSGGLNSSLTFKLQHSLWCVVDFTSEVSQFGIRGPGGTFGVIAKQDGHAVVRISNATVMG